MKNLPSLISLFVSLFACAAMSSCVTGPAVSAPEKAAAASFAPPPGKALLYVYRSSSISTMTAASRCWVDGNYIGKNGSGTFMAIPLKPGNHIVSALADPNTEIGKTFPSIRISAVAGKNYFVQQKISPTSDGMAILPTGVVPGLRFEAFQIQEVAARQEIIKCRQVGSRIPF